MRNNIHFHSSFPIQNITTRGIWVKLTDTWTLELWMRKKIIDAPSPVKWIDQMIFYGDSLRKCADIHSFSFRFFNIQSEHQ